jgi:uncharacterized protein
MIDDENQFPPDSDAAEPVIIPHGELDDDTLRRVIEAFVLREGTEYGAHDVSLEQKVLQVQSQLQRGEARVVFHPDSESIDIIHTRR